MSMYRKEWDCCGSVTETNGWELESCLFCKVEPVAAPLPAAPAPTWIQPIYPYDKGISAPAPTEQGEPIALLRDAFVTYMACPTVRNYDALLDTIPEVIDRAAARQAPTELRQLSDGQVGGIAHECDIECSPELLAFAGKVRAHTGGLRGQAPDSRDAAAELDRIKRMAACGTVDSFLALPEQDKRYWFAMCLDESERRKRAEERLAFLHSTNKDAEGYEFGVARVKFDAAGNMESFLWALSDHSDLDRAIAHADSDAAPLPRQAAVPSTPLPDSAGSGKSDLVDDALAKVSELGTVGAMKWLAATLSQPVQAVPDILFDGMAVYEEITRMVGKGHCISPEAVAATLDAAVRMIRAAGTTCRHDDGPDERKG